MDQLSKLAELLKPVKDIFGKIGDKIKYYLNKFKFFLIFLLVATVLSLLTGFVTYWYKAIYEPQRELALRPNISVDSIISETSVNLSIFALPKMDPNILEDEYLFSLATQEVWEDELVESLRLPSQELGLNQIISDSNSLMEEIISTI